MERIRQAGAIAVKMDAREPRFLVVTARKDPQHWIFPKGHIQPGETEPEAALRELREEAGVEGKILDRVGQLSFRSGEEPVDVTYYLVRCLREVAPEEARRYRWLPFKEARRLLTFDDARALLDSALEALEQP